MIKRFFVLLVLPFCVSAAARNAYAADEVLFEDSFDGDLSDWTVVSGEWVVKDGVVEGGGRGVSDLQTNQEFSGDLIVEFTAATVRPADHDIQCMLFANGYTFVLGGDFNSGCGLLRHGWLVAWTDRATIEPGRDHLVRIMRRSGRLECLLDDALVLSWTDPQPLESGPITLRTWESKIAVGAIRVRRFPAAEQIRIVSASTGRPLSADAVAQLRAADCSAWQVARVKDSSRLEPTFAFRTPQGAYRATFCAFQTEQLDEYADHDWFCHHFAGRPALRVRLQHVGSPHLRAYVEAAGLAVLPVEKGDSVFIDVAGMAAGRTAGRLELFCRPPGGAAKPIAARQVTLGTASAPLLSRTLELETEGPGTYGVIARLTTDNAVITSPATAFHVMADDELFDAGDGLRVRRAGFTVDVEKRTGAIKGLFEAGANANVNYVANETNLDQFGWRDTRFFGDVVITSRLSGMPWRRETTSRSYDVRQVAPYKGGALISYADKSAVAHGGFQNVRLWELYRANPATKSFDWDVIVENAQTFPIEIGEVALPLLLNDTFFDVGGNRQLAYTQRVLAHAYAGGHSGFVLVQRLSGEPPYLLIVPAEGTAFEEYALAQHHLYGPRRADWCGLRNLYLHSRAAAEREHWKPGPNPNTAVVLDAGQRHRFGLHATWINSYEEIAGALFRFGKIGIQVAPGMVVPTDQTAHLLCWSGKPIRNVQHLDDGITIVRTESKDRATLYTLRFKSEGEKRLRLYTSPSEWTMVAFYAVPPIEQLIEARARFITDRQRYRNPDDALGRDYGFMPWDSAESAIAEQVGNPSAIVGCSDLGGFADPLFLARKNVYRPDERQIEALEQYVEHCLFGHVQDPDTYLIRGSLYVGQEGAWPDAIANDTSRTDNYALALNIYYDLYRIGTLYGLTKLREPKVYLEMAANTAIAMLEHTRWRYDGQVGGDTALDVLEALDREGLFDKHAQLLAPIDACCAALEQRPFPYGGPTMYDPTAYAHVYRLFRRADSADKVEQALHAMLAVRGKQPVWHQYGTDRHWWHFEDYGKRRGQDEVGLFYTSAVNGTALLDEYRDSGQRDMLLLGYAGVLSPWAAMRKTGEVSTGYHIDPRERAFDALSTAGSIGLWGALDGLGSYLVRDPQLGLVGFGCAVSASGGYTIVPRDGLYKRAYFQPVAVGVRIDVGRLTKVATTTDASKLWIAFAVDKWFEKQTAMSITGLRHGWYTITVNDKADELRVDKTTVALPPITTKGGTNLVVIERIEEETPEDEDE